MGQAGLELACGHCMGLASDWRVDIVYGGQTHGQSFAAEDRLGQTSGRSTGGKLGWGWYLYPVCLFFGGGVGGESWG